MNIAVIGATGMVGERTVTEATARGHQVEGYSRSGQAVAGAEGTAVDLSNTGELVTIINSHYCCLGRARRISRAGHPSTQGTYCSKTLRPFAHCRWCGFSRRRQGTAVRQ